ncbi:MAG: hypothetical protein EPN38_02285 [Rhodanobacteraceae bacterium]|nr:MAG: hypothetical protein EPN38_02285 [Rhodanobacteraceae bacterium]
MSLLLGSPLARAAPGDSYAAMLAYLTASQISGSALNGSAGAIALNLAAGDQNQQANLRALAVGNQASVQIHATQQQRGNQANLPGIAIAGIGGRALGNAAGLISINQASGTANAQLNTAGITLAQQGMRATPADQWLAGVCACAQEATPAGPDPQGSGTRLYSATVAAGAMHGMQGVVQLNQIAGSNNVTANQLSIEAGPTPR